MTNNKLADKCFCDRMYPDSNPNASCGDCPTRDYAPKPTPASAQVDDTLGRFGHHPDPATDFEIEVESLQGRLFNAKHAISDEHGMSESVAQVAEAIKRAMAFRVGGVETSVRAKSILRALELESAPAADGAGELPPLPEPTCLGFRNPCGITQLPDMGIYGYTADQVRACQREAIAAALQAQQPGAQAVAWHTDDHLTDKSATTYDPVIADRWRAKGWPVTPHYTDPQPPSIPEPSDEDEGSTEWIARRWYGFS